MNSALAYFVVIMMFVCVSSVDLHTRSLNKTQYQGVSCDDCDEEFISFRQVVGTYIKLDKRWESQEYEFEFCSAVNPRLLNLNTQNIANGFGHIITLRNFGRNFPIKRCLTDFNSNDITNVDDLSIFLRNFSLLCS